MGCLEDNDFYVFKQARQSTIYSNGAAGRRSEPQPIHLLASQHPGYRQGKA